MKKVTLELLVDENGDEDINPNKSEIESVFQRCYHNIKLVSYEEESIDARWFCAKDVTPPVPEHGMCSEDVIIKYKDGTESVACITALRASHLMVSGMILIIMRLLIR